MINIILLNYNTAEDVIICVEKIKMFTETPHRIYIVDNNSPDDSAKQLVRVFSNQKGIEVLCLDSNTGYSGGNNNGIIHAEKNNSVATLIINPDVVLENNAIDIMYWQLLSSSEEVVVAGPSIKDVNGQESQVARTPLTLWTFLNIRRPLNYLNLKTKRIVDIDFEKDISTINGMVSGCCFLIKSDEFKRLSYFDDGLFLYFEEDILAHKLKNNNLKSIVCSNAKVIHNHSVSISKQGKSFSRFYSMASPLYVLKNYAKCGRLKMWIAKSLSISTYGVYSIFNSEYRGKFRKFFRYCKNI